MATETPPYAVLESRRDFELRRYAPSLVAEVEVEGGFGSAGNRAFRILAGFIFGGNREGERIAMTAPVTQEPAPSPAPEGRREGSRTGEARYRIAFFMPAHFTPESLPTPEDPRIRVRELPGRTVAAHGYTGTWSEARYREREARLLTAVAHAGLETVGPPVFARYDAPFTLPPLRRNEILVEIRHEPG